MNCWTPLPMLTDSYYWRSTNRHVGGGLALSNIHPYVIPGGLPRPTVGGFPECACVIHTSIHNPAISTGYRLPEDADTIARDPRRPESLGSSPSSLLPVSPPPQQGHFDRV